MASSSNNATTGAPEFDDADAPDVAVNPTEVGAFAAYVGTRIIGDNTDMLAYAYARDGLQWWNTTNEALYQHDGSSWIPIQRRIVGRMIRSSSGPTMSTSAWTDASTNSFWTADVAEGIASYSNGWTIPSTGRYRITYELRASGPFGTSVAVNNATPNTTDVILAQTAPSIQGVIAYSSASGEAFLSAGDVIRLFAIRDSGSPVVAAEGLFSIEWVGND